MSLKRNRSYHTVRLKQVEQRPFASFWNLVLQDRGGENAIFSDNGSVLRRFHDIEQERIVWRSRLAAFSVADCLVAAIGNDPTWPALLLACWDLALVVVPVEPDHQSEQLKRILDLTEAQGLVRANETQRFNRPPMRWEGKRPHLLKVTSGTTGASRA